MDYARSEGFLQVIIYPSERRQISKHVQDRGFKINAGNFRADNLLPGGNKRGSCKYDILFLNQRQPFFYYRL